MQRAVKPFVVLAKQHFRPLAGPISELICLMFRASWRWAPEMGALVRRWGPEMGTEGSDQPESLRDGGPPIIPPSRKLIVGVWVLKRVPMVRAVRGEMALRSR